MTVSYDPLDADIRGIVNVKATPESHLEYAKDYLSDFMENVAIVRDGSKTTLTCVSEASVAASAPYSDEGSMSITWDGQVKDWDCECQMFRTNLSLDDPKLFFANLTNAVQTEARMKQNTLDRIVLFFERWRGDRNQFVYDLGLDLGEAATTTLIPDSDTFCVIRSGGARAPTMRSIPDFEIWFSAKQSSLGFETWYLGFHEAPDLHIYEVSAESIDRLKLELESWITQVSKVFQPLVSLEW